MQTLNKIEQIIYLIQKSPFKLVFYATGCAASAMGWLTLYPGSSKYVLSAQNQYSRGALTKALNEDILKSVDDVVAQKMSIKAFLDGHSIINIEKSNFKSDEILNKEILGVGVTGALRSAEPRKGLHHAYISLQYIDRSYTYYINLVKDKRSRTEEDVLISEKIFQLIALHNGVFQKENFSEEKIKEILSEGFIENETLQILQKQENILAIDLMFQDPSITNIIFTAEDVIFNKQIQNAVVMSGSFNPFHIAHQEIAEITSQACNIGKENIIYELAISNADKGKIDTQNIMQRVQAILDKKFTVCITNSPLFTMKNQFITNSVFALGIDTFVRILDKKYYSNDQVTADLSLMDFRKKNNKFAIAPRFNEKTQKLESIEDIQIPKYLENSVIQLAYQNNISSTLLRQQKQQI